MYMMFLNYTFKITKKLLHLLLYKFCAYISIFYKFSLQIFTIFLKIRYNFKKALV